MGPFVRSPYNYDMSQASDETALHCLDESRTQQQFRDEADINTIVRRFGLTGELPESPRLPAYGDFTGLSDYREALHAVQAADASFMALPADIRARFQNDPQLLLEFVADDSNLAEARKLGLLKPELQPPLPPLDPKSGLPAGVPAS